MKQVYLDNAATTPVRLEVEVAMRPYFCEKYGNPSGVYQMSSENRGMIENVREQIAKTLNASAEEIYFTSGGTESDNWAIKAAAQMLKEKGRHIITSKIEHHAILNSCAYLEKQGFEVTYLDVDEWGSIRLDILEKAIRKDTILISVMYANNEVGTIQKIAQIGKIAEKNDILFHTDAVQAYGQLLIDVKKENIDLLSASAHKFNGPKGVGFLYIRKKIPLPEYIHGGKQERNHRAGTENVPGIAGMGKAAEIAFTTREYREKEIQQLRDYLIQRLQRGIPYCRLNGSLTNRLPGNCNISFQFIEGNELLLLLDEKNICASAASACSTGDTSPSHVLTAMGIPEKLARGTLRLTIGYQNTQEEIDYTVQCIKEAVEKLRENAEDPHDSRSDRSDDGQNHRHRRASHTAQGSREEVHDAAEEIRNRRDRQNFHTAADNLRVPGVNLQDFRTEQIRAATHHQCHAAGENQAVDQHLIHSFVFSDTVVLACEAHARLGDGVD